MAGAKRSLPPVTKPSGEHPAVRSFRAKMESISDGEAASNLASLDASLEKYLQDTHSEPPPDTLPEAVPPVCSVIDPRFTTSCSLGTRGCSGRH